MVAPHALWYNIVRIHKTLRTTLAMAAGIESTGQAQRQAPSHLAIDATG